MKKALFVSLALAGVFIPAITRAQFADGVVSYNSGSGFIPGFIDPATALGAPSQVTVDDFGGPVDPFNPPFLTSQVVSLGTGGSLVVHLDRPILNSPSNPFGMDFIIFGNAGFSITNDFDLNTFTFVGTPATDGSLFGNNPGVTRVQVSADGLSWYTLNPALVHTVDDLFPTYGSGDPVLPVNPALTGDDFSGQTLSGIQSLYAGSAGGTGFDLAWAQDTNGVSVVLSGANYVRVDVLSGTSEIDAISVVPEPTVCTLALAGAGLLWLQRRKK